MQLFCADDECRIQYSPLNGKKGLRSKYNEVNSSYITLYKRVTAVQQNYSTVDSHYFNNRKWFTSYYLGPDDRHQDTLT